MLGRFVLLGVMCLGAVQLTYSVQDQDKYKALDSVKEAEVLAKAHIEKGDIVDGEGVMGLRRAFTQAGAQNLLMTLWPVSDKYTTDFIKAFYDRAMADGDAPQALADVQREFLVKYREKFKDSKSATRLAVQLAGPFILSFQGNP